MCSVQTLSFLLQNSGNASKRSRCQSFSRKSHLYRKSFLPHRLQSFCHLLEILLKTLFNVLTPLPPPPPPARGLHYSLVIQVYQHIGIPEILQSLTFVSQDQGAENWSFECISYKKKGFKRFKGLFIVESALSLSS